MTSRRNQPAAADPAARIKRLQAAIGDGPHAASFDADHHLRCILVTLGDKAALELLKAPAKAAA